MRSGSVEASLDSIYRYNALVMVNAFVPHPTELKDAVIENPTVRQG